MPQRKPKTGTPPRAGRGERRPKSVVVGKSGPDAGDHKPTFSFHYADRAYQGEWSWPSGDDASEFLNFLCDVGQSTWSEVLNHQTGSAKKRHRKHHEQSFESVCPEAQRRLTELRLDETFEELFRFRLSNMKRLWGFRANGVFYVLWWDPNHRVYPPEH